jgi:CheY-like chemotaxis protein
MGDYVLIVDDDLDTQKILTKILGLLNWQTQVASEGTEALTCIRERRPALIMLDIMMPGMNGLETLGALKRDSQTRDIPVVIISALGSDQRFKRLGATHVLPKGNFTLSDIMRVVNQALGAAARPS